MAKKKQLLEPTVPNFVAKHMHTYNQAQVHVDRKKAAKRGYSKHQKGRFSDDRPFLCRIHLSLWGNQAAVLDHIC